VPSQSLLNPTNCTVGDRAFVVAGARLWNSLPHDIFASDTLTAPLWTQNIFI